MWLASVLEEVTYLDQRQMESAGKDCSTSSRQWFLAATASPNTATV
jgi:hypothetical protein